MRKAISFFVVSIVMYLVSLAIASSFNIRATYKTTGTIAIVSGFIFLFFPLETLQFFGFFPKLPIYILMLAMLLSFGAILLAICILEITLPLFLGYFLINSLSLPQFNYMIGIIIYLTIWIAHRKQYINLISDTWNNGTTIIENSIKPLSEMTNEIDNFIDKVHNWVRTDK